MKWKLITEIERISHFRKGLSEIEIWQLYGAVAEKIRVSCLINTLNHSAMPAEFILWKNDYLDFCQTTCGWSWVFLQS